MKRDVLKIFILLAVLTGSIPAVEVCADFENIGVGARPIAMGNAFVGLADDANAIYYNPAGLGFLTRSEVTSTYGRLFMGLSDGSSISNGFIGYIQPINNKIGNIGIGWLNLSLTDTAALVGGQEDQTLTRYAENIFIMSYGRDVTDITNKTLDKLLKGILKIPGRMAVGINMKFMMKAYGLDDYSKDAMTDYGFTNMPDPVFGEAGDRTAGIFSGYDMGLFYKLENYRTSFGMVITDINAPNTAIARDVENLAVNPGSDNLARGLKLGAAYREPMMNIVFDLSFKGGDVDIHTGIERWFHGKDMALRAGYNHGSRSLNNITVGAGYKHADKYQFDYVFLFPLSGLRNLYGSHRISLSMRFGEVTEEREIRKQAQKITRGIRKSKKVKGEKIKRLDYLRNKFLQGVKR